jgi:hypothetical protein
LDAARARKSNAATFLPPDLILSARSRPPRSRSPRARLDSAVELKFHDGDDEMTPQKKVLLIGLDPKVVDYAALKMKLDEPTLRAALAADEHRLQSLGYDAHWLLIDRGETAVQVVSEALEQTSFDCILIGAGIRTIPPLFLLFEKLVNVAHEKAPHARLCFNTLPEDTAESVQRWV